VSALPATAAAFGIRMAIGWMLITSMWLGSTLIGCWGGGSRRDATEQDFDALRAMMVRDQIEARGVRNPSVLAAMGAVPRHELVPESVREHAYEDRPLPIGHLQTISQPFVVAAMSEALDLGPEERVLEIGTGSGYQAAVLSGLCRQVFSIEIVAPLAERARTELGRLGYDNVQVRSGDGYQGWPEQAPFDAIVVTAAPDHVPQPLLDQLAPGGRLVMPVGDTFQELIRITRTQDGFERTSLFPVRFVPMTGEARQ
jgi:protein-L-isoaspartate(D-aspartate) O-methyltransferase